jgi:hypothetical protein
MVSFMSKQEAVPSYAPPPVAPPPQKKSLARRPLFWILLVVVVLFGGCVATVVGISAAVHHVATEQHTVVYSVTGSGTSTASNITYATLQQGNGQNGEAQVTNSPVPWTKTITASGLITAFSLSVQNGSVGLSYVTCSITEDGKVLNTNTAKGPYAIASCSSAGR